MKPFALYKLNIFYQSSVSALLPETAGNDQNLEKMTGQTVLIFLAVI